VKVSRYGFNFQILVVADAGGPGSDGEHFPISRLALVGFQGGDRRVMRPG
jgi:hypothetical protein